MRRPRCPKCRSTNLTLFCVGAMEWTGRDWVAVGEVWRPWFICDDCGHDWRPRGRHPDELSAALREGERSDW